MKKDGTGGHKTVTGLIFENKVDFLTLIERIPGYTVKPCRVFGTNILFDGKVIAQSFKKHGFYRFLESRGINWTKVISKQLLPDDAILVMHRETLYIIEVKYQQVGGSVDEKLQTCDFKRKQYLKLVSPLNIEVEYIYVLNEWFEDPRYKDVLDYIHSMNCRYRFRELPLTWLGLPSPKEE